jgi:hypothetical protein
MTPRLKRNLLVIATITLWAATMGWLILSEAYPGLLSSAGTGYRAFFSRGVMVMDQWMKISFQGKQIGYSNTSVDVNESNAVRLYQINNRTILQMNVMGSNQRIAVTARATVDAMYHLQTFSFVLSSTGYSIAVEGARLRDNLFDCKVKGQNTLRRQKITIPDDAILYSPMTEVSLKSLPPGRHITLRMFNPMTLSSQNVTIRSLRRESLHHAQTDIEATVLSASLEGMETLSWVDSDGKLLRQETLFGWVMEACTADEALSLGKSAIPGDMLTSLAVPVTGPADRLASAHSALLTLTGAPLQTAGLETQRQSILSATGDVTRLLVRADTLPTTGLPPGNLPAEVKPFLAASAFIQSDDRRMLDRAHAITGTWTNSLTASLALYDWIYKNVEKIPTVSLPSALDVLLRPQGDCNEHTYLFVALARAAGIPAKIRVGLTLHNGMFYYHAWPSVYVGRWLDMDPTLNHPAAPVTHIALLEGELAEQMKLMGVVGRLKVEITDINPEPFPIPH